MRIQTKDGGGFRRRLFFEELVMKLKFIKAIAIISAAIIVVLLCGCGNSEVKELDIFAGTWKLDSVTMYSFDGEGNGKMTVSNAEYEFDYTISENELEIDFISEAAQDSTYEFVMDGSSLTLSAKDRNRGTYELTKVE